MGCAAGKNNGLLKNPIERLKFAKEMKADNTDWNLHKYSLLWFDQDVENEENKQYKKFGFDKQFASIICCKTSDKAKDELKKLDNASVLVISSESDYPSIQKELESSKSVNHIFVFPSNQSSFATDSNKKNVTVCGSFEMLREELEKIDKKEGHPFYTINDKDIINHALTKIIGNEGYSIFYPIGFKGVTLDDFLLDEIFDEIINVAKADTRFTNVIKQIKVAIYHMKFELTLDTLIESCAIEPLFNYLSLYLSYGEYKNIKLFSEYLCGIQGGIIEKCNTIIPIDIKTVYRAMNISVNDLKKYESLKPKESFKNYCLLPTFTSTTSDINAVSDDKIEKINIGADRKHVKFIITLTDENEEFCNYLKTFDFIEGCGVLYPFKISQYKIPDLEKRDKNEVLFPPFYPFKLDKIEDNGKITSIYWSTPRKLCYSSLKDSTTKRKMKEVSDFWSKRYIDKALDLVKNDISTDITLCKKNVVRSGKVQDLLKFLEEYEGKKITKFGLDFEPNIAEADFDNLMNLLSNKLKDNLLTLSLDGTLENKIIQKFADKLGTFEKLLELDISDIKGFDMNGIKRIMNALTKLKNLKSLSMNTDNIGLKEADEISQAIGNLNNLEALDIGDNNLGSDGAEKIVLAVQEKLKALNISDNYLEAKGAEAISGRLAQLKSLTIFNIGGNNIGPEGGKEIAKAISEWKELSALYINDNNIGPNETTYEIYKALINSTLLTTLDISCNNIGHKAAKALATALYEMKLLITLNIDSNDIGAEGAKSIAPALSGMKSLSSLNISNNNIGPEGTRAIAICLSELKFFTTLDISNNKIGTGGVKALSVTLKDLKTLSTLDISDNDIGPIGTKEISTTLAELKFLTKIFISNNKIGPKGTEELTKALKNLILLKDFNFDNNKFDSDSAGKLAGALSELESLSSINARNNLFGNEDEKKILESIENIEYRRNKAEKEEDEKEKEKEVKKEEKKEENKIILESNKKSDGK